MLRYDNPLYCFLNRVVDLCIVNCLFLICCVPIITYGAAKTALYSCVNRWLQDDDADAKWFFMEFKRNIRSGVFPGLVVLILMLLCLVDIHISFSLLDSYLLVFLSVLTVICLIFVKEQLFMFQASFICGKIELIKNGFLVSMAYPLRSILSGVLSLLPIYLFVQQQVTFMRVLPILLACYYSLVALLFGKMMIGPYENIKKKFRVLQ